MLLLGFSLVDVADGVRRVRDLVVGLLLVSAIAVRAPVRFRWFGSFWIGSEEWVMEWCDRESVALSLEGASLTFQRGNLADLLQFLRIEEFFDLEQDDQLFLYPREA